MTVYRIATDAVDTTVDAEDADHAAVIFARSERMPGIDGLASLVDSILESEGTLRVWDPDGLLLARVI